MKKYFWAKLTGSRGKQRIAMRFRAINLLLFVVATVVVVLIMVMSLLGVTKDVSKDIARLYSTNTSSSLSALLNREIALIKKAAGSDAVRAWFSDEGNQKKKAAALSEMLEVIGVLEGHSIFLAIHDSMNEYNLEQYYTLSHLVPRVTLSRDSQDDAWYFKCVESEKGYSLNVGTDRLFKRKRVWVNHKVESDGVVLGAICSGLDFSLVAEELLSEYDNTIVRGVLIDEKGIVQMDSRDIGSVNFLSSEQDFHITNEHKSPEFLAALENHFNTRDGFFDVNAPVVIESSDFPYRYATIAPVVSTNWSVVTFFNSSSLFSFNKLMPLFVTIPILFILFILANSAVAYLLLFKPVELLIRSLSAVGENSDQHIYGVDRADEIGSLAKAIRDLQNNAFDRLTGAYNRRYLNENVKRLIKSMARYGGTLSVLMVDMDYCKKYNDLYGYEKGNECIKMIAKILKDALYRVDDFVARYSGEEFAVVLPNTDQPGARVVAEKLLKKIRENNIPHSGSEIASYVTVSIGGTASKVAFPQDADEYLKLAHSALHISKSNGRNQYRFLA
jgi:diguanylate cyclase (GGDEF)-like protein